MANKALPRDIVLKIIEDLYNGEISLTNAIKKYTDTLRCFFMALEQDLELDQLYLRAQTARAEMLADQIIDIADNDDDWGKARNRIDVRKWYASKIQPKKYGDRIDLNVNQTVDVGGALAEARNRLRLKSDSPKTIDAQARELPEFQLPCPTDMSSVVLEKARGLLEKNDPNEISEDDIFN